MTLWLHGMLLGLSAAATPGPLQAFFIAQASAYGPRRALPAVFAPLLSDGPIVLVVLLALDRLPPSTLDLLQRLGGAYLLFLAYRTFRLWRQGFETSVGTPGWVSLTQAALVNLLNPNPYLFWSTTLGPMTLEAARTHPPTALGLIAAFYGSMIGLSALLIVSVGRLGARLPQVRRVLVLLAALALAIVGLLLLAG